MQQQQRQRQKQHQQQPRISTSNSPHTPSYSYYPNATNNDLQSIRNLQQNLGNQS
ncbi:MAG: hypothetical protein MHMPM18_004321, partial [Marteilia pararefringens]